MSHWTDERLWLTVQARLNSLTDRRDVCTAERDYGMRILLVALDEGLVHLGPFAAKRAQHLLLEARASAAGAGARG